jgi:hypothetical protein
MSPEQFRALLERHGGLTGHQILDPQVDTTTTDRLTGETKSAKGPNPSPRVRYVTREGEITARQNPDGTFDVLDDPKGFLKDDTPAGSAKPIEVSAGASLVQKQADGSYAPVYAPPDKTKTMTPYERASLQMTQAGQALQQQRLELDKAVAEGRMTREARNDALAEAVQRTTQDIAKARLAIEQQQADTSRQNAALANRREDRMVGQAGRQQQIDEATLGRGAGQDAVSRAEQAYGYRREQAYAAARASGKSPQDAINESAQTDIPDFDTIAEAAAQRAVAGLGGLTAGGRPPIAPPAPAGAGALPSGQIPYPQPGGVAPSAVIAGAGGAPAPLVAPLNGDFNPADYAPDAARARAAAMAGGPRAY